MCVVVQIVCTNSCYYCCFRSRLVFGLNEVRRLFHDCVMYMSVCRFSTHCICVFSNLKHLNMCILIFLLWFCHNRFFECLLHTRSFLFANRSYSPSQMDFILFMILLIYVTIIGFEFISGLINYFSMQHALNWTQLDSHTKYIVYSCWFI